MNENNDRITELQERMKLLIKKQNEFVGELRELREEVKQLKIEDTSQLKKVVTKAAQTQDFDTHFEPGEVYVPSIPNKASKLEDAKINFDFEKFIGENLVSKLGILITIIGVVIGAKYSIDNDLISPLTRIILGYLMGIGLMGFGIKLKEKYENYSAVLVSGAIAILYFITFAAYSFYDIFPQLVAFLLMVMFTIFTVIAAINYDKQVIAHIGLVGAYAVPFFLSNGSGDMLTFFSYITIINIGILAIAYKKYWKKLYYAAFGQTWLIFLFWFDTKAILEEHFGIAFGFATVFFILFYLTFLAYKVAKKEEFDIITVAIILLNSFIYFAIGHSLLSGHVVWQDYLGLFTLANALIHFGVGSYINKQDLYDKNLFYLIVGLVLTFITIAIPIQFDGNWVTLLWAGEAALLFWIGRTKQVPFYEMFSYALMAIGFLSICQDWTTGYYSPRFFNAETSALPIFNIKFLTSFLFIAAFAFINKVNIDKTYRAPFKEDENLNNLVNIGLFGILSLSIYFAFRAEIAAYFNHLYDATRIDTKLDDSNNIRYVYNSDLLSIKNIWLLNYTIASVLLLSLIDLKKLKNTVLGKVSLGLNGLLILAFLTYGIYESSNLHSSYFNSQETNFHSKNIGYIAIKYLSFAFFAGLFVATYRYIKERFPTKLNWVIFDLVMYISILTVITSEFLNWLETAGASNADTLTITIVWGVYALMLIALGIWKKKQHLRIGAFALFGITLVKLFFYDIAHLDTISKTVVLVSLGILLLVISFLYNKYKHLIEEEEA
ncbi:MAG: putative membrane protein [Saprospiraceae bacterium]|jgi:uncharacterized membrane protein